MGYVEGLQGLAVVQAVDEGSSGTGEKAWKGSRVSELGDPLWETERWWLRW